ELTLRKLVKPLPSHRLALRYISHHLNHFTFESSSGHSSSDHSSSGHSISGHSLHGPALPDITVADHLHHQDLFIHYLLGLHGVARPISVGGLPHYLPCIHR
ncbi:hypothetical protein Tco_0466894, partial [Tanacetum coccineum]